MMVLTRSLLGLLILGSTALGQTGTVVEPEQLTKDPNLVGRIVVVDDRIQFFLPHKGPGGREIYDELRLKRTDVPFRLPPALRTPRSPRERAARIQGVLQRDGRSLFVEVESMQLYAGDLERLEKEVASLAPNDLAGRRRWAEWATRRAAIFKDADLEKRARDLEVEVVVRESEAPAADPLGLAARVRERGLGEPLAGSLGHLGFRARLATAKSANDLDRLARDVAAFFPRSSDARYATPPGLEDWTARLGKFPGPAYREAPDPIRAAWDRRLLADVLQKRFEVRLSDDPASALVLAEEAKQALPDRPAIAERMRDLGLAATEAAAANLRLSEVESLAKTLRSEGKEDRARKLLENWLSEQRTKRLDKGDADGRVLLASHYERLLSDRATAALLLQEAVAIAPDSREAADSLRRMGYRRTAEGRWVDGRSTETTSEIGGNPGAAKPAGAAPAGDDSLLGLTPEQVRARFGSKPDRVSLSITQAETIEQWVYSRVKGKQIINFRRTRGQGRPRVVSSYSLP
ncbi:MAG: hypothetical protein SFX72_05285 [Isosphaeraceae bacterium]|nr:hypothetical protein [Isosphaeraceae bacterium]